MCISIDQGQTTNTRKPQPYSRWWGWSKVFRAPIFHTRSSQSALQMFDRGLWNLAGWQTRARQWIPRVSVGGGVNTPLSGICSLLRAFISFPVVVNFRYSDRKKLTSLNRFDRVIAPSQVSTSDRQQQSGAGKIRPVRPRDRRPSTEEVFALEVQPSAAANANSSPSPNGSADQIPSPISRPSKTDRKPGKQSTKEDKSNAQRCLRGMPPELQNSSYFVPDDDDGSNKKSARNDPFWEAPEAHSTPRRPSIAEQSTSLFKPSRSSENLPSTNDGVAAVGTSNVPMSFVVLSGGDIGESSTDNGARVA